MRRRVLLLTPLAILCLVSIWVFYPLNQEELKEYNPKNLASTEEEQDNPGLAAEQNFEMTKDPALGYPPSQRKIEAFGQMLEIQRNKQVVDGAIPGVEWTERGSDNVGGRTRALMWDPNDTDSKKLWAGATGGGLWFLDDITDPTARWQNATGIMDNLAISTIAYDPSNTNTFYLGTGVGFTQRIRGEGIWKSTDGGTTWTQLTSTADDGSFHFVQRIQVTANGTVLAAKLAGLMRSTDGGESWTQVQPGRFADIEVASNGKIFASSGVGSSGSVFVSDNNGATWTDISPEDNGQRIEIAIAPSNPQRIYAVADGGSGTTDVAWFRRSNNGGSSWEGVAIPMYLNSNCGLSNSHFTRGQAWFDLILAVHPENPDILIAGGIDLHRSTDGGDTWEPISFWTGSLCDEFVHADQHGIAFRPGHPNEAVFSSDGGIDYSTNVGNSDNPDFERRVRGYNTMLYYAVAMANEPGSDVMLAGAQDNGTQRFDQPGLNSTWMVSGGDGAYCFIDQNQPSIQISSYVYNVFFISRDGGKSFRSISSDQASGRFINPADYDDDQGMLFSAGAASRIKRIRGIGITQNPQSQENLAVSIGGGQISTIKISPNQPKRLFLGTDDGNVYRIDSTHQTTLVSTPMLGTFEGNPGAYVSSIDVGATDDHLLITYSNYGVTSVYETKDGGTTWQDKEGNLPDMPVRWGLFNPDNTNEVLLATELGVWSTNEFNTASPTWEPSNSGLASVRTDMLKYRSSDKLVAAATYGRGVFTSDIFADTPLASFKADRKVGYVGKPIQFTNGSQVSADDFAWDFGDENTSIEKNPSHIYNTPGTYTVSLAVNSNGSSEIKTDYITILPNRSTPYTLEDGGDFETDNGDFAAASLLHDLQVWERGTPSGKLNTPSSGSNVWKTGLNTTLGNAGYDHKSALYTPAFDLSDESQDYTLKFNLSAETLGCNSPTGLYVEYSTDGGERWQILGSTQRSPGDKNWYNKGDNLFCSIDFEVTEDKMGWTASSLEGDFNLPVETKLNHLAGNANVAFRIIVAVLGNESAGYNLDGFMIDDFEISSAASLAEFEAETTRTLPSKDIQFNYTSAGAESFLWNFGDGNTSTDQNPIHQYSTVGEYTVSLTITKDGNESIETKTDLIKIVPVKTLPYLLSDGGDFETNQDDFTAFNPSNTGWSLGSSSISGKDGTASGDFAWVTGINSNTYIDRSYGELISPTFAFTDEQVYTLEFKAKFSFEDNWDGFIVEYSTDGGNEWTKLNERQEDGWYNQISDPQAVFGAQVPIFSGDTFGTFDTFSTDVSFLFPNEEVSFRFLFMTDAATIDIGAAIDDFQITAESAEPPVADFTVSATSACVGETITFTSNASGTVSDYEWRFGAGASPASATGEGPHEVTYAEAGSKSVSLRVINVFNQEDIDDRIDYITINEVHTPTFTKENTDDWNVSRLVASAGDSYQWYKSNDPIPGATEQNLLISENGLYSVDVTINGCTARSTQQSIVTSIDEDDRIFERSVTVYPNPVTDLIKVGLSNEVMGQHHITVIDAVGNTLSETERIKSSYDVIFEIDARNLIQGNYLIRIVSPRGTAVKQVIKQ